MQFRGFMKEASFLAFRILSGWDGRCAYGIVVWPHRLHGAVAAAVFPGALHWGQEWVWLGADAEPVAVPASPLPVGCSAATGR